MDGKLWAQVYQTVMTIDHPDNSRATFSDRVIALIVLRASYDELSINSACKDENWQHVDRPAGLPDQSTVSRRSRSPSVRALLQAVEQWLRERVPETGRVVAIDGRPLTVNGFSKDDDARWGYATGGLGRGYKIHAIWGKGCVPLAWEVRPLNASESTVALRDLLPRLPLALGKRYLVGDASYDTNALHGAAAKLGFQLLAPQKKPGKGLGHRQNDPARIRGLQILKTRYGKSLYRQRTRIERQWGNATMRPEGLNTLPAHVRRLRRVTLFVHAKLILNGFRILQNQNALTSSA